MAINFSTGFDIRTIESIDRRFVLSKQEMRNERFEDGIVIPFPGNYFCVCKDDGQMYTYNNSNTRDPVTGKFRPLATNAKDDRLPDPDIQDKGKVLTVGDAGYELDEPASGLTVDVVEELPTEDIDPHALYLVPKQDPSSPDDLYDEYLYVDGEWDKIGSTDADLSDYVKFEDLSPVATTGDYNDLTNKPTIPSATSELDNDSGFITENDIPDPDWSDIQNKPEFATIATTGDYNDLLDKPTIPTTISELENDSGFVNEQDLADAIGDAINDLSEVATSGDYNDLLNKPTIPTATSELTNDSGFVDQEELAQAISDVNQFQVEIVEELPEEDIDPHTIYFVPKEDPSGQTDGYDEYMYINEQWEKIGNTSIDLSNYVQFTDLATVATSGDYNDLINKPTIPDEHNYIDPADLDEMLEEIGLDPHPEYLRLRDDDVIIFNETLSREDIDIDFDFVSGTEGNELTNFAGIFVGDFEDPSLTRLKYKVNDESSISVYDYAEQIWSDVGYRTVKVVGDQTITDADAADWIRANATIVPNPYPAYISLDIGDELVFKDVIDLDSLSLNVAYMLPFSANSQNYTYFYKVSESDIIKFYYGYGTIGENIDLAYDTSDDTWSTDMKTITITNNVTISDKVSVHWFCDNVESGLPSQV